MILGPWNVQFVSPVCFDSTFKDNVFCHPTFVIRDINICWNGYSQSRLKSRKSYHCCKCIKCFSIYTLSDLGVLSNLIGSLSLANEHYSPPTEWIMRKPNKNKMAGVNSSFASVSESIFNGFLLKMLLRSLPVYIQNNYSSKSRWIVAEYLPRRFAARWIFCHYSPRFRRIIVK